MDAGVFYCPYVPLQMVRAVDSASFQPQIAFKTRYGLVANPFAENAATSTGRITGDLDSQSSLERLLQKSFNFKLDVIRSLHIVGFQKGVEKSAPFFCL